ncbi:hypothetical protein OH807_00920 [Kitasatospora sp. NBC_01560]
MISSSALAFTSAAWSRAVGCATTSVVGDLVGLAFLAAEADA